MKKRISRDFIIGLILIITGIISGLINSKLEMQMTASYPGPKLFPYIAVFGLIVCGFGILIKSKRIDSELDYFLELNGWKRLIISFVLLIIYYISLRYLGYLITTPIILTILSKIFDMKNEVKLTHKIFFSIVFTITIYNLYVQFFSMRLPRGILF